VRTYLAGVAALALLAAGCGGGGEEIPALPAGSFVSAGGSLSPPIHLFGDTVTAQAIVVVDRRRLDPGRIRLKGTFTPYEQVGETQVTRRDARDLTELRFEQRLRCLGYDCITATLATTIDLSGGAPRTFRFLPAQVLYDESGATTPRTLRTVRWGPLLSVSRINAQEVTQVFGFPFRATVSPLPGVTYRIPPVALTAILLLAAVALLALPTTLVVRRLRRRRPLPEQPEPEASPLEQAIRLVEWSLDREDADRRAALEALAVELDAVGDQVLADDARGAGWSPSPPALERSRFLIARVEETHGVAV
jgi:hypothetical protein